MIIRHFEIQAPEMKPPAEDGWEQLSLGYYWMTKCMSAERRAYDEKLNANRQEAGYITTGAFQQDCLLSILTDMQRDEVNFIELGAGWGRVCLNLAGTIDFKLVPCNPKRYRFLAVEAEPTHFEWLQEHFKAQNINGTPVFGAVSSKNGNCRFQANSDPDFHYGQGIAPMITKRGIPNIHNIRNFFARKTIKVPMHTLDYLIQKHDIDHVDIVQMDVQGAEHDVIIGAEKSIKENKIDYFLINVHNNDIGNAISELMSDKYETVINLERVKLGRVAGFPPIDCHDGIQLYKRKIV